MRAFSLKKKSFTEQEGDKSYYGMYCASWH